MLVFDVNLCFNFHDYFYNSSLDILVGSVASSLFNSLYRYNAHFKLVTLILVTSSEMHPCSIGRSCTQLKIYSFSRSEKG